jgi:hypothetical protein
MPATRFCARHPIGYLSSQTLFPQVLFLIFMPPNRCWGQSFTWDAIYRRKLNFRSSRISRSAHFCPAIQWCAQRLLKSSVTRSVEKLEFYVAAGALEKAQELVRQLNAKPPPPLSKRGAGARIRQEQTDLKYLGALKLLEYMSAREASRHTEKAVGKSLFSKESEWSRAKARAQRTLAPYRKEAALLLQALDEKRVLNSFSFGSGETPKIDWET